MRRRYLLFVCIIGVLIFTACAGQTQQAPTSESESSQIQGAAETISSDDLEIVAGQTLYVPAYSEIFSSDETTTYDLAVMVSIRNTDFDNPIIIESIQYYDSAGNMVKDYVESPLELGPMATTEVVLSRLDKQGGTGANFIIIWGAEQPVHEPIVEALMTSTAQQQGVSFLTTARVLQETP